MTFFPVFKISLMGGWWFSAGFLVLNLVHGIIYPLFRSKTLVFPGMRSISQKITMPLTFIIFQSRIIMAVFIPIRFTLPFSLIGSVFTAASLAIVHPGNHNLC